MPVTFASFASTLGSLSVAGVTAQAVPPQRIPSGILPIGYSRLPLGENKRSVLTSEPDLDQVTCDYVVLVEAAGQNTLPNNYAGTIAIMDLVHAALKATMAANHIVDGWNIRMDIEVIGETPYWAVVATVRGSA